MADLKSWNPWHGCRKYSEGCAHCYMYALDRIREVPDRSAQIARTQAMHKPLTMDRRGNFKIPSGYCLRVNMTSDTFLEEADGWRGEMWDVIRRRPDVRFYILTKRVARIAQCLPPDWGDGWENVELNFSCENQRAFDERWPIFREIPAKHKGMNLAPLIGEIDISPALASGQIECVCCGGESFGGERPCRYEWVKRISDDCRRHRVNFAFNSTGTCFEKDGKIYRLEMKDVQAEQAFKSRLSCFFGEPEYKLFDPFDRHRLAEWELMERRYHADKCPGCTMMELCIGCVDCGSCKNVRLVGFDEATRLRNERLSSMETKETKHDQRN